jgi:arylsulfatase A-like enzyme/Tfp pilus assembly protein PilF
MSRRSFAIGAIALALSPGGCTSRQVSARDSEIVLLVTIDTLRSDRLGCGGDARARTPFLDRLARGRTQMAVAIAPAPLTLPSHATILSGWLPPEHGARDNGAFRVPDDVPLVAESFRAAGWSTAAFVAAAPLAARFGLARGFEVYGDSEPDAGGPRVAGTESSFVERPANRVNEVALAWLGARDPGAPLFLWIHYFDPHSPYRPPPPLSRPEGGDPYRGEITFVDRQMGRLARALDAAFARRRTCVTADHGESLGEHGEESHGIFVYESTTRVPWIVAGEGVPAAALELRPASLTEIAPALLAWCGIGEQVPVSSLLAGGDADSASYAESMYPALRHGWAALRALRTSEWKVIRAPEPELYDLRSDPGETNNIWGDETSRTQARHLVEELADPRWEGRAPVAAPLDAESEAALRALGYVGTSRTSASEDGAASGPDPKTRVRIEGLLSHARSALDAGNLTAARSAITRALGIDARNKETQLLLARVEARAGNFDRAFEVFDWCLELPPASGNGWVEYERGRVALDAGRLAIAEEAFARAVEHEPLNVDARHNWGVAAYHSGRFEDAATRWRDVLALEPDHGPTRRWLPEATARLAKAGS